MGAENTTGKIRDFLGQFIGGAEIDPDEDLFASGLVNSLFAMQLVLFVEKEFGIQVANQDLDIENFKSLNAIVGFVDGKTAAG